MDKTTVGNLCKPYVGQLRLDDDTLIDYFDISSVDNIEKRITGYTTYTFAKAPSRARKQVKKGDILVSTVRPNLNAVALFDKETKNTPVVSTGLCVLECKADTSPRFLLRYLQSKSFVRAMVSQATGASYPAVSDKIVRDAQIPAYSYEEQIQIANVLDATANIISKQKQQLQKLDDLIKARFVELFGDPVYNSKRLPIQRLCKLGSLDRGRSQHRPRNDPKLLNGPYPLIQTGEVASAGLYITKYKNTYSELGLRQSKMWSAGTLCITIAANIAQTAILTFDACFPDSVVGFLPNDSINAIYMHYWFGFFQKILEKQAPQVAQKNINLKILSELNVIVPTQEKQEQFAAFVEQIDKSKVAIQKALDEAQLLFDGLMQKYFG